MVGERDRRWQPPEGGSSCSKSNSRAELAFPVSFESSLADAHSPSPVGLVSEEDSFSNQGHDLPTQAYTAEAKGFWFEPPKMWMPFSRESESNFHIGLPMPSECSLGEANDIAQSLSSALISEAASSSSSSHQPPTANTSNIARTRGAVSSYHFAKRTRGCRWWTTFIFATNVEDAQMFQLVPRMIGHDGESMKSIAASCMAKLRIRGRGSRYLEVQGSEGWEEADIPLQLFVGAPTEEKLQRARELVTALLDNLSVSYSKYRERLGLAPTDLYVECSKKLGQQ